MRGINKTLHAAIGTYYKNRSKQSEISWNKEQDLQCIENAIPQGYSFQAVAGTFWIRKHQKTQNKIWSTNEKIYPNYAISFEYFK